MIYNYWNEDTVREEALKYVKRSDFKKLSPGAYEKSKLLNIFEDVCKHMPVPFKWTIDLLKKEALKYNTLTEFTKNSLIAYNRAKKINILDDICKHMIISKFNKWDYDNMLNEALKYNNRQDFRERSRVAYEKAQKINILDDICSHMTNNENRLKDRIIYAYEFSDNFVYIGLTYNIKKRDNDRKRNNKDSVTEHINKTGLTPVIKILTPFIPIEDAKKEENNYIDKYKINGWYI